MLSHFRPASVILPILLIAPTTIGPVKTQLAADTDVVVVDSASCPLSSSSYITWHPKEVTCPVCSTKNIFMVWGSYGSYIYSDPSKYQLIFWPYTDSPAWWSCKKCKLSMFMGDFEDISKDKIAELQKMLVQVTLPAQKTVSDKEALERPPYLELPVSARLIVAEKVYQTLGQSGEGFWAHFYRVQGYHLDKEGSAAEAAVARQKALKIVEGWLTDKSKEGERKEFLYICGAMRHFLHDDPAATKNLEEAAKLKYSKSSLKAEQNENYDQYLSSAISEYLDMLKKGEGPKN